jgi:hypothetical protein
MGLNVISETVGHSVLQFINYSLILVIVIIVYQLFKLVTYSAAGSEAPDSDEPNKIKEWLKGKKKEAKLNDEQTKRKHILGAAKDFVGGAIKKIDKTIEELDHKESNTLENTKKLLEQIRNNLHVTRRIFNSTINHDLDAELRTKMIDAAASIQTMKEYVKSHIKNKLPNDENDNWDSNVATVKTNLNHLKGQCGAIISNIDKFVKEGELDVIQAQPPARPIRPLRVPNSPVPPQSPTP